MGLKILAAAVAVALLLAYLAPVAWKLKETSLYVVMAIGLVMMAIDLLQSLKSRED